jgi:hypothetical protein
MNVIINCSRIDTLNLKNLAMSKHKQNYYLSQTKIKWPDKILCGFSISAKFVIFGPTTCRQMDIMKLISVFWNDISKYSQKYYQGQS